MANRIELQAILDAKQVTKGVREISNVVNTSFKSKSVEIFSGDTMDFLKGEAQKGVMGLKNSMSQLKNEAAAIDRQLKEGVKDEKLKNKLITDRIALQKQLVTSNRELTNLQKQQNTLAPKGIRGVMQKAGISNIPDFAKMKNVTPMASRALSTVTGAFNNPALSGAANVGRAGAAGAVGAGAAGISGMGMAAVTGLAAAAGAAAVAIMRMSAAADVFKESIPKQLVLDAIDQGINRSAVGRASNLGFDVTQMAGIQESAARSFGAAKTSASGANRLENIMLASRSLGMSTDEITQGGNQLRQIQGTEGAQKQMAQILNKAITSGMDKSQASTYLSTAIGLLTNIDKTGMSNTDKMLSALTEMTVSGMAPEMAARTLTSMNDAISGSSGENNMFFQTAAARAGLGGNNLLGTQLAVQSGLSGLDATKTSQMLQGTQVGGQAMNFMKGTGVLDQDFTQKFAQGILGDITNKFDMDTQVGAGAALDYTSERFGGVGMADAAKILATLEKISTSTATDTDKKILEDFGKDPSERWRGEVESQLKTIAGNTEVLRARGKAVQFELGEKSLKSVFNPLTEAVIMLDKGINGSGLTEGLGSLTSSIKELATSITNFITNFEKSNVASMMGLGDGTSTMGKIGTGISNFVGDFFGTSDSESRLKGKKDEQLQQISSMKNRLTQELTPETAIKLAEKGQMGQQLLSGVMDQRAAMGYDNSKIEELLTKQNILLERNAATKKRVPIQKSTKARGQQ